MENPKFIIAAGCSFTASITDKQRQAHKSKFGNEEGLPGKNWPVHLSTYLNCQDKSYFIGKAGADNSYIANITLYTLANIDKSLYKDLLVGIMWSGVSRKSVYLSRSTFLDTNNDCLWNPTKFAQKVDSNYYLLGSHLVNSNQYKTLTQLSKSYYSSFYDPIGSVIESLKNILLLQNFLKINNINYFFTEYSQDCISRNKNLYHPDIEYLYKLLDKNNFLPVLDMSHWIDNNLDLPYHPPHDKHPTEEMSLEFTNRVIIPHLKNKGYID